jgi:hypothetical protein
MSSIAHAFCKGTTTRNNEFIQTPMKIHALLLNWIRQLKKNIPPLLTFVFFRYLLRESIFSIHSFLSQDFGLQRVLGGQYEPYYRCSSLDFPQSTSLLLSSTEPLHFKFGSPFPFLSSEKRSKRPFCAVFVQ